ncbi:MAG: hypothetical protein HUK15_04545, partial [Bacteroidales bacterium]|nr:hypothetical protein [Bacteroidales bacterium]
EPTALVGEKRIKVYGTSANGQTIMLTINAAELGDYSFSTTNGHYAEFVPNMASGTERYTTQSDLGSGMIRLTSLNTETRVVGGEFYFKAVRPDGSVKSVSEGKFINVPFTYYNMGEDAYASKFQFTHDGIVWQAKDVSGTQNDTAMLLFGDCDRSEAWQSITLAVPIDATVGTHYIGTEVSASFQSGFYTFPAVAGAVTIAENNKIDKVIRGTFFFNYRDNNNNVKSITDGSFDIKYTDLNATE